MSANPFRDAFHIRTGNSHGDCMECSGTGEIDSGRDFPPTMDCDVCGGSGHAWTAEDEAGRSCDLLRSELIVERSN